MRAVVSDLTGLEVDLCNLNGVDHSCKIKGDFSARPS